MTHEEFFKKMEKLTTGNRFMVIKLNDVLKLVAIADKLRELLEKIKTMREVGNNYVSQLEVRVAESQQERDALLIRVGYLERTIEQLKGEKK